MAAPVPGDVLFKCADDARVIPDISAAAMAAVVDFEGARSDESAKQLDAAWESVQVCIARNTAREELLTRAREAMEEFKRVDFWSPRSLQTTFHLTSIVEKQQAGDSSAGMTFL